jgi:acetolactate synthase-1/2/3 large subunit
MEKISVSKYILSFLKNEGIKYIFGYMGSNVLNLIDAMYDMPEILYIQPVNEQGASAMATGFSMVSDVPGVCMSTTGAGAANLVSGLDSAYQNSIPVLAITGQVFSTRRGRGEPQDPCGWGPRTMSHHDLFRGLTKWSVCLDDPRNVKYVMQRAFREMLTGRRGPVHIDLPIDVQNALVEAEEPPPPSTYRPMHGPCGNPELIKRAARMLLEAHSPAILAGGGALYSNSSKEILQLAELLGIPVATSLMGKSVFPEMHPLSLGVAGSYGHALANEYLRKGRVDVLLVLGCSLGRVTTNNYDPEFGGDRIIQVDIDPSEIGKNYPIEIGIVGDIKVVLTELIDEVTKNIKEGINWMELNRLKDLKRIKNETRYYSEPEIFSDAVPIKPQRALKEIRESIGEEAIVFGDAGSNLMWTECYLKSYYPKTFLVDGVHTHMGWSFPASMGAKLAMPNKIVAVIMGDSGFLMTANQLATAATYKIPVIVFILNNRILAAMRDFQKLKYGGRYYGIKSPEFDVEKFADAFGAFGKIVERPEEIKPMAREAIELNKPAVIDIRIDPEEMPPSLLRSAGVKR